MTRYTIEFHTELIGIAGEMICDILTLAFPLSHELYILTQRAYVVCTLEEIGLLAEYLADLGFDVTIYC